MSLSITPVFNLKAVLIETSIKPDVLRAWERRYGLPMPQRTAGGQRLYSEYDVHIIKWLMARQVDGLSISSAVEMWKHKSAQRLDPLAEGQLAPQGQTDFSTLNSPVTYTLRDGIDEMRSRWLAACLDFNENSAEQVLNQAFALYPVEAVCMRVLQRGMAEIGALWYENHASVQQEHFASALAVRRLDALLMASPAPIRPESVIVGCPADEWHTFTPLLMALLIRRRGYTVIYLGANIPASYFVETVQTVKASLVLLAAQHLSAAVSLQQSAAQIAARGGLLAFGGRVFSLHPDLVNRVSGYYLGDRLDEAIDRVEGLLLSRPALRQAAGPSQEYELALQAFTSRRSQLEADLELHLAGQAAGNEAYAVRSEYFRNAHKYMGDAIVSALSLGNINYLDSEIEWLQIMLQGHHIPGDLLSAYLAMYSQIVDLTLATQVPPLESWLHRQLASRAQTVST